MDLSAVWKKVIESLEEKYSEMTAGLWFSDAVLSNLDADCATVIAADDFKRGIIEQKYLSALEEIFKTILGFSVEVKVKSAYENPNADDSEEKLFRQSVAPAVIKPEEKPAVQPPNLQSEYTFENFVVGSSNELAQAAAYSVSQNPAEIYNPLFLFGPSGLGKTHLMFAVMNEVKKNHPDYNILYVTSEEFTNELIDALATKQNKNLQFKSKYRNVDMLLVDDVQFIEGKYAVQEEFFHTFNALYNEKKQIILTSDRMPRAIEHLEERLVNRFESGLMADIQPPDTELRAAIFKMKARSMGITINNEVLALLSENITNNVRQIEGALKRLRAQSFITGDPITLDMAKSVLKDYFINKSSAKVTIEKILNVVSKRYGFSVDEIRSRKRSNDLVYVRHIAMYLCTELTSMSLKTIGRNFDRDHSTVISARDSVIKRMKQDAALEKETEELTKELTGERA